MGMHGWMACLQQLALALDPGQQILHLAPTPLGDPLYYKNSINKHGKHTITNHQTISLKQLSSFSCVSTFKLVEKVWINWPNFIWLFTCVGKLPK